tara:strand:+ start:21798 stop:22934 length:1137 start_codon:yes stop_codon:yes gene_type:complete
MLYTLLNTLLNTLLYTSLYRFLSPENRIRHIFAFSEFFEPNEIDAINNYLKANGNVTSLDLRRSKFGAQGAKDLGVALHGTNVTSLSLEHNHIGDQGAKDLGEALQGTNVTKLNLSDNEIGAQGAKDLGEALQDTNMTKLNLCGNEIGDQGAKDLGKALQGTNVTKLNLCANEIGDQGVKDLGKALQGTNVTSLSLEYNNIVFQGLKALGEALQYTSVTPLFLKCIKTGDLSFLLVDTMLAANREKIANERLAALNIIKHCAQDHHDINEQANNINDLPEEMVYKILGYIPSLQVPAKNQELGKKATTSILNRIYNIVDKTSSQRMDDDVSSTIQPIAATSSQGDIAGTPVPRRGIKRVASGRTNEKNTTRNKKQRKQ